MSFQLPSGLTAQQLIDGLGELSAVGLSALGQPELAALVPLVVKLAEDGAALLASQPSANTILQTEVDAEQAALAAAELAKFGPKP